MGTPIMTITRSRADSKSGEPWRTCLGRLGWFVGRKSSGLDPSPPGSAPATPLSRSSLLLVSLPRCLGLGP
eukprot:5098928-Pyramimonas_sp.AAC.1